MISIDAVYRTVRSIINKDEKGELVPRDFNNIARQAQDIVFSDYFKFLNKNENTQLLNMDFSDIAHNIREKIAAFEREDELTKTATARGSKFSFPNNFYRIVNLHTTDYTEIDEISRNKIAFILKSPLSEPRTSDPVYVKTGEDDNDNNTVFGAEVFPSSINSVLLTYVRRPAIPNWVGTIATGRPVADVGNASFQDFELHQEDSPLLVNKILELGGVSIRDAEVIQAALAEIQIQQSKQ